MKKYLVVILFLIVHCTLKIENCTCQWVQANGQYGGEIHSFTKSGNNIFCIVKNPNKGDTLYAANTKGVYKVFSQSLMDTASAKYFPLAVGNIYIYLCISLPFPTTSYKIKSSITKDTLIYGIRYYYAFNFPLFMGNQLIRYDSITECLIARSSNSGCFPYTSDTIIDSLAAKLNNESWSCTFSFYNYRKCVDTSNVTLFDIYYTKKKGFYHDGNWLGGATYARNFGLINCQATEFGDGSLYTLVGCVLNGVVYGDTSLTGISNYNSTIPDKYSLSQNYPNPFNPTTKIKFEIPSDVKRQTSNELFPLRKGGSGVVSLKVFDITGREITTLVNERLQPGTYEVTFDASTLPSGIYFYQLKVGDFVETKKLILLK